MAAITIFSDAIDVLDKIGNIVISAGQISGPTRRKYAEAVEETHGLILAAVNLVYLRLGDLLNTKQNKEFLERASPSTTSKSGWSLKEKSGFAAISVSCIQRWTDLR